MPDRTRRRLPWFKCRPAALLGALNGMAPDAGYLYVTILMRIYEDGGPVQETPYTLSRRTGMTERRVAIALTTLTEGGRISILADGRLDSESTHSELSALDELQNGAQRAGKRSAEKRTEKSEGFQRSEPTDVERKSNERSTIKNKIENKIDSSNDESLALASLAEPEAPKRENPKSILAQVLDPQAVADLIAHRKAMKAPLTDKAAKLLLEQFAKRPEPPGACVEQMIRRTWKGFDAKWPWDNAARAGPTQAMNGRPNGLAIARQRGEQATLEIENERRKSNGFLDIFDGTKDRSNPNAERASEGADAGISRLDSRAVWAG